MSKPYLSIVVAARNDNYGGDFIQRFQNFINWNTALLEQYKLPTEIVIVNWNPLEDKPSLKELMDWPESRSNVSFRIITVPYNIHQQFVNPEVRKTVPLFEFIAKNAGIRRAKGEFLLCTNCDVLFDPELIEFLASQQLQDGTIYRCDRLDYSGIDIVNGKEDLSQIQVNVFRFFIRGGTYTTRWPKSLSLRRKVLSAFNRIRKPMYHALEPLKFIPKWKIKGIPYIQKNQLFLLTYHCNASGDFSLMHKNDWLKIKGYDEETLISTHVDTLLVMRAVSHDIQLIELNQPVYHQDHERRFDFGKQNEAMNRMQERMADEGYRMANGEQINHNTDEWGLNTFELQEESIE